MIACKFALKMSNLSLRKVVKSEADNSRNCNLDVELKIKLLFSNLQASFLVQYVWGVIPPFSLEKKNPLAALAT